MGSIWRGIVVGAATIAVLSPAEAAAAASAHVAPQAGRLATGCRVADTIRVGRDPRGVAVNPRTNTIYVANVQSGTVSAISRRTGKVTGAIHVAAFSLALDPKTAMIYVTNASEEGRVAVLSARSRRVVATVPVGHIPLFVAVNPRTNVIYVTNQEEDTVSVISGMTNRVTATIPVGRDPAGIAVDPRTDKIYVTSITTSRVAVISGRARRVTTAVKVNSGLGEVAVNPKTGRAYVTGPLRNTVQVLAHCRG